MIRLGSALCLLAALLACGGSPTHATEPSPLPIVETITVGQQLTRRFTGVQRYFDLVAPKQGRLEVALTWDGTTNGTALILELNGTPFRHPSPGRFPLHLTAGLKVTANQGVRIAVFGGGTDIVYDDPFVLATTID